MGTGCRGRILVVEDDEAVSQPLKTRLETAGFKVHTEGSGKAGLTYAKRCEPELVILDLKLPDMSGYEVCGRLRRLYSHWIVPVLMLTGMDQPIDQLRGFAFGADAYLTKPYDPVELLKTVSLLLKKFVPETGKGNGKDS